MPADPEPDGSIIKKTIDYNKKSSKFAVNR